MPRIEARISSSEKSSWQQFCLSKGLKESCMLRMMINQLTNYSSSSLLPTTKESMDQKITIRLSTKQQNMLKKKALTEGYLNQTHWVQACVFAQLFKDPVLTDEEISALRQSNRQIAAIGCNLNQIARILNIEFRESDKITSEAIAQLNARIDKHKQYVAKLLQKNLHRWNISTHGDPL